MSRWKSVGRSHGYKVGEIVSLDGEIVEVTAISFSMIEVEDIHIVIQRLKDQIAAKHAEMEANRRRRLELEARIDKAKRDYQAALNKMEAAAWKIGH